MSLLIKHGTIVTATDQYVGDVLVEGEKISTIGSNLTMQADRVIDATGKYVFPGGIDVHTHLDMPFGGSNSADDFESGTIAAAHGGTTTIVDFAIQYRGQTLHHAWETWMKKAEGKAAIDYGFHMIITELNDQVEGEMDALVTQGVTSFKLFMAYPGVFMLDDASIFKALLRTGKNGGTICMHAENGGVIDVLVKKALAEGKTAPKYHALTRPARAEAEATHRAIALAEIAEVPIYIVHLSAAEALEMVTEARDRGLPAYAETCPQYLFLSYDNYEEPGFDGAKYVMSPPLRAKETQDRLWRGLAFNDLQAISTDHCPFCMKEQKTLGEGDFSKIPNGAPGIETRMSLVYDGGVRTGKISLNRFVELTSTSPAKIFGLFPRKGTIAPGSDADIVVFDPNKKQRLSVKTLHMNVDYNPYEGREVTGVSEIVISRGRVVIDGEKFTGRAGAGSFLKEKRPMTGDELVALSKKHTLFEWSAQGTFEPIPVARAKGVYFWTPEGKRFLDFNSQLMCVNIGHGDPRVIKAIHDQASVLAYANPFMATEPRARLGAKLAEITPGDIDVFFFTNGGAEANENAFKIARAVTGRQKILSRYRSYHGATAAAINATGDPRRWSQPPIGGFVHVLDPYHGVARGWDSADEALRYLDEVIQLEGPSTIAAFILESVTGTNGILVPPDGYLQGVRALCDRHGILMIADEVMAGFGRTGEWFAINHWKVVPDIITMAKGLTSAYVQLGAVGVRRRIADHFTATPFPGGLTYNSHPLACAAALAAIAVMEEDGLVEKARRTGALMTELLASLAARHPSVGAVRSIGLFGAVELVRNRKTREPMAPFNGTSPEMIELGRFFRQEGLYTFVRWNSFFTNPPLSITEDELHEGFGIIDRALAITDQAVV